MNEHVSFCQRNVRITWSKNNTEGDLNTNNVLISLQILNMKTSNWLIQCLEIILYLTHSMSWNNLAPNISLDFWIMKLFMPQRWATCELINRNVVASYLFPYYLITCCLKVKFVYQFNDWFWNFQTFLGHSFMKVSNLRII